MKTILIVLACIVSLTHGKITYENCLKKGSEVYAELRHVEVSPDPPSFSKNVTVTMDAELLKEIPENLLVKMNVYKITGIFGIPIPAPCFMGVGSCTTPYCKFLGMYREQICPFFPEGVECGCKVPLGKYGGDKITVPIPNLGPIVSFLASGNFRVDLRMVNKDNKKELFCYVFKGKAVP